MMVFTFIERNRFAFNRYGCVFIPAPDAIITDCFRPGITFSILVHLVSIRGYCVRKHISIMIKIVAFGLY